MHLIVPLSEYLVVRMVFQTCFGQDACQKIYISNFNFYSTDYTQESGSLTIVFLDQFVALRLYFIEVSHASGFVSHLSLAFQNSFECKPTVVYNAVAVLEGEN